MAVFKDRKLVPVKETWDLESLVRGAPVQQRIDEAVAKLENVHRLYKSRLASADAFFKYLEATYDCTASANKVLYYAHLRSEQDTVDAEAAQFAAQLGLRMQPLQAAMGDEDAVDIKNRAKIEGYLKQERFAPYRRGYEKLFMKIPHVLSEAEEKLLASLDGAFENNVAVHSVLTNAETTYEDAVGKDGKKRAVTLQTYPELMRAKDRALRKSASDSMRDGSLAVRETLSRLLGGHYVSAFRLARARKYEDHIERSMADDNVKPAFVERLYSLTKDHLAPRLRYHWARQAFIGKALGIPLKEVRPYDKAVDYVPTKSKYSVDEAVDLVVKSVAPLGADYVKIVKDGFASRWVDFHKTPNKRDGAFASSNWAFANSFVLTNFSEDLYSVFTLAHEMGHALHAQHTNRRNPPPLAGYPIFTAEVASNFCELLMMEQLLKTAKDDKIRYLALERFLENFDGNVYAQMVYSEFEYGAMKALKENRDISSWRALSQIYFDAHIRYAPDPAGSLERRDAVCLGVTHVPHYYYNFYVYKYTVGMIGALSLMAQLKADQKRGAANYVKFISAGRDRWPADILKDAGVDLEDPATFERAFGLFADYVEQFIALGEKIFKVKAPSAKWVGAEVKRGLALVNGQRKDKKPTVAKKGK